MIHKNNYVEVDVVVNDEDGRSTTSKVPDYEQMINDVYLSIATEDTNSYNLEKYLFLEGCATPIWKTCTYNNQDIDND